MKKFGLKLLAVGAVAATFSFASCKSNGYGCDYGAVTPTESIDIPTSLELEETTESQILYTKYSKE